MVSVKYAQLAETVLQMGLKNMRAVTITDVLVYDKVLTLH